MFFCRIKSQASWYYLLRAQLLSFCLILSLSVHSSGVGRFIDFIVTDSGVMEALSKNGLRGDEANYVRKSISNSLQALSSNNKKPSAQNLKAILDQLPVSGRDVQLKSELVRILESSSDQVSPDEFVQAVNNLIYLANRYSLRSSSVLACSECVNGALAARGFRFTMEVVDDVQAKKVLSEILPNDPRQLRQYIQSKMRSMGLGDFSKVTTNLVAPEEERSLALFLGLKEYGSQSQKNFIAAVEQLSRNASGEVQLLDPARPHKLWRLFYEDLSDDQLAGFTKLITEVDQEARSANSSLKEAFGKVLEKRAADNPAMQERAAQLQRQNCFFQ